MRLHQTDAYGDAFFMLLVRRLQHRIRLADASTGTKKDLESPAALLLRLVR